MKGIKTLGVMMLLVCLMVYSAFALDLKEVITVSAEIDDQKVTIDDNNRVQFERGDVVELEVRLNSSVSISNIEITAFISGYEFNDIEPMSATSSIFDVEPNISYKKSLSIKVPTEVEEDSYKLRVLVSDRFGKSVIYDYDLYLDSPRSGFQIEDVVFSPGTVIQAGRALLTTVRVENMGSRTEESVKVSVAIPDLGVSASDFIDEVTKGDSETTEEMYLRIPVCAEPGVYKAVVEVRYNDLREAIYDDVKITVVPGDGCVLPNKNQNPCNSPDPYVVKTGCSTYNPCVGGNCGTTGTTATQPETVIALGATSQKLVKGTGSLYPMTVTNNGANAVAYTVTVEGTNDFASVQVNPVSTFILGKGESQAVFLYVTPTASAAEGSRVFTVVVKAAGQTIKQVPLTAVVEGKSTTSSSVSGVNLRDVLEIGLFVLIVLLIILVVIVAVKKMKKDDDKGSSDDEEVEGKTYY